MCAHQGGQGRYIKTFGSSFQAGVLKFGCLFKVYPNVSESFGFGNHRKSCKVKLSHEITSNTSSASVRPVKIPQNALLSPFSPS